MVDGIASTSSEFVIVMDADLQHPPEILPDIVKALENHDFVMASRYIKGGSPGEWKLSRKIVSKVATLLALPLAPKIQDPMSGFFGFKSAMVNTTTLESDSDGKSGWKSWYAANSNRQPKYRIPFCRVPAVNQNYPGVLWGSI